MNKDKDSKELKNFLFEKEKIQQVDNLAHIAPKEHLHSFHTK